MVALGFLVFSKRAKRRNRIFVEGLLNLKREIAENRKF